MSKLTLFDTHCHLADQDYHQESLEKIIVQARDNQIKFILNVGYDEPTNHQLIKQIKNDNHLFGALGIHPNNARELTTENFDWIEQQLKTNSKIVAIGEIGLDYYRDYSSREEQFFCFKKQLQLAKKYQLPVLLHLRDSFDDAYEILKELKINQGILHCFTGDWEIAEKFLSLGFYISFAGNITYKNGGKRQKDLIEVVKKINPEKIVIETDSPYLTPEPFRGKKNYPQNLIHTFKRIAEIKSLSEDYLAQQILQNTFRVLKINQGDKII